MFKIGDIFSKHYKVVRVKRYFLVLENPKSITDTAFSYIVLDFEDGDIYDFVINHDVQDELYPIALEA